LVTGKVLVIGLDGATFNVLNPLIEKLELSHLSSLFNEGASGLLQSVFPPVTGPAWTSFMTGKNPGKHGIIDFVDVVSGNRKIVNSHSIRAENIWSILGGRGVEVGIVNVPVTYPPYKVNGFMISGMPTPEVNVAFSFPPSLGPELKEILGPYTVIVPWMRYGKRHMDRFLTDVIRCTQQRGKYTTYLMEKYNWDFFMVVFNGTDVIAHALWDVIDDLCINSSDSPRNKCEQLVSAYFQELDKVIGEICDLTDNNTTIFVVSDHGFGPMDKKMHINNWLSQIGLLSFDATKVRKKELLLHLEKFLSPVHAYYRRLFPKSKSRPLLYRDQFYDCINWKNTKAFSASFTQQGIYINLKGREPYGIVNPGKEYEEIRELLIAELRKLSDPETGKPMVNKVYKKEEVYDGPFLKYAPDIMFILQGGRYQADDIISKKVFEACSWRMTGTHRMEGIVAVKGKGVKKRWQIKGANIIDLAPTILYSLGVPVPDDMEGNILTDIYTRDFIAAHPIEYTKTPFSEVVRGADKVYSTEEEDLISQKLKDLGYLD
jgi:predicted AlkP superfamily phosphohydrolase/phosphomutase